MSAPYPSNLAQQAGGAGSANVGGGAFPAGSAYTGSQQPQYSQPSQFDYLLANQANQQPNGLGQNNMGGYIPSGWGDTINNYATQLGNWANQQAQNFGNWWSGSGMTTPTSRQMTGSEQDAGSYDQGQSYDQSQ